MKKRLQGKKRGGASSPNKTGIPTRRKTPFVTQNESVDIVSLGLLAEAKCCNVTLLLTVIALYMNCLSRLPISRTFPLEQDGVTAV